MAPAPAVQLVTPLGGLAAGSTWIRSAAPHAAGGVYLLAKLCTVIYPV
jgi:hypothetical protein